eukprot:gene14420-17612_t
MAHTHPIRLGVTAVVLCALLAGCATEQPSRTTELTLLSINDFHGNIQPARPTPLMPRLPDPATGEVKAQPAGGVAHLATALAQLKAKNPDALVVAGGDLIGASPLLSALFFDEPAVETLNQIGLDFSSVGNHEFDKGKDELRRLQNGGCKLTSG